MSRGLFGPLRAFQFWVVVCPQELTKTEHDNLDFRNMKMKMEMEMELEIGMGMGMGGEWE